MKMKKMRRLVWVDNYTDDNSIRDDDYTGDDDENDIISGSCYTNYECVKIPVIAYYDIFTMKCVKY